MGAVLPRHVDREAALVLEAAVTALAGGGSRGDGAEAFQAVGPGGLVVLDDLPRVPGDDPFADRLIGFARAARTAGVRLLSTSPFVLAERVRYTFGDRLKDTLVPAFTDAEAADLLHTFGAPAPLLTAERVRFLNVLAAGQPASQFARKPLRYDRHREVQVLGGPRPGAVSQVHRKPAFQQPRYPGRVEEAGEEALHHELQLEGLDGHPALPRAGAEPGFQGAFECGRGFELFCHVALLRRS